MAAPAGAALAEKYREKLRHEIKDYEGGLISGIYSPTRPEDGMYENLKKDANEDNSSSGDDSAADKGSDAKTLYGS